MEEVIKYPADDCTCGYKTDTHTDLAPISNNRVVTSRPKPKNGDMTVCAKCAHIWVFDDDGKTKREPTEKDFDNIRKDSQQNFDYIMKVRDALMKGEVGPGNDEDRKWDDGLGKDNVLDQVYLRAQVGGTWGSYSIRDLFMNGEGGQVFEWVMEKIDDLDGVTLSIKSMKLMVYLFEELGGKVHRVKGKE